MKFVRAKVPLFCGTRAYHVLRAFENAIWTSATSIGEFRWAQDGRWFVLSGTRTDDALQVLKDTIGVTAIQVVHLP